MLFLLFGQSRTDLSFYPVIVLVAVLALQDAQASITRAQFAAYTAVAFALSRLWLPIGRLPTTLSLSAYASGAFQRADLSSGAYTSSRWYLIQLLGELAAVLAVLWVMRLQDDEARKRRRGAGVSQGQPHA